MELLPRAQTIYSQGHIMGNPAEHNAPWRFYLFGGLRIFINQKQIPGCPSTLDDFAPSPVLKTPNFYSSGDK